MKTEKITLAQFKQDVITELKLIKKNATAEEKDKLILSDFYPDSQGSCIYGLMAGYCRSERAMELIKLCCQRFVKNDIHYHISQCEKFSDIKQLINGKKVNETHLKDIDYFSSLETFILVPKNKKYFESIFAFLKGETETINL
jgi:hypothetical protein